MTKLHMARYITAQLFREDELADPEHWKVLDLMKATKPALEDLFGLATDAYISRKLHED